MEHNFNNFMMQLGCWAVIFSLATVGALALAMAFWAVWNVWCTITKDWKRRVWG